MKMTPSRFPSALLVPFLSGLFLVSTTGFDVLGHFGVFNGKRLLEVLLLLLILSATLLNTRLRATFGQVLSNMPRWLVLSLLATAMTGLLSVFRFPHPGYGLLEIAMLALLLMCLFATAAARCVAGERFDRLALIIVVVVGLIAAFTEIIGFVATWTMGMDYHYPEILVRFYHPRFYNHLQTFSIPLLASVPFVFGSSKRLKALAVILIALQWWLLLLSGGRGTVVSLATAFILAAILFPSNRFGWLKIHAAGLALGLTLFFAAVGLSQTVVPEGGQLFANSMGRELAHTSGRTHLWRIGLQQALDNPLLGSGPSRYSCEIDQQLAAHPHGFHITLMSEWGFPVFGLIMIICAWLGWRLITSSRRMMNGRASPDILPAMLACSVMAAAVHALVSGVLIMPASQVMLVLVGGWTLGRLNTHEQQSTVAQRSALPVLLMAWLLAASVSIFSFSEIHKMELRIGNMDLKASQEPRFWQAGHSCQFDYDDPD